jgi:hypothetical protein
LRLAAPAKFLVPNLESLLADYIKIRFFLSNNKVGENTEKRSFLDVK